MNPSCATCRSTRRELHRDRTGDVVCLRCYSERGHGDPSLPADRPRTAPSAARRQPVPLDTLLATLTALELAPVVIYPKTPTVRCVCPACGSPDRQHIWRSLLVDGRNGLTWSCDNGCRPDRIATAFRTLVDERTSDVA